MYAISIASKKSDQQQVRETNKANQLNSLINVINIIYGQLKFIKGRSINGNILDEIIERTEIVAFNIKHNHAIALSTSYIDDYQKDLWQILAQLHDAEMKDGMVSHWEEHKGIFFELFKHMNETVEKYQSKTKSKELAVVN